MSVYIKVAVIGHPISHSKSPLIHNYWIEKYGLHGAYDAIDIAPEQLRDEINHMIDAGYKGFNVTVPHKEAVLKLCDSLDMNAQNIGAVNTVVVKDAKLHGMNTDAFGFLENIRQHYPHFSFDHKCAAVLGAGGAARAVISGLIGEQVDRILLINRTPEKADALLSAMDMATGIIKRVEWDQRSEILDEVDLLINTTSLGMSGQPSLNIDLKKLPQTALVNDIVYAPLETELLKAAKAHGAKTVSGIGMLLHQARSAFKAWFGVMPEVTSELEEMVLR